MNENTTTSSIDLLRRKAKRRCHLCPGIGFISLGYPSIGLFCLLISILTFATCVAAVVTFSHVVVLIAGAFLLVRVLLHRVEIVAVSKAKIRELPINRFRSIFLPSVIIQIVLVLTFLVLLFGTTGNLRMRGAGMAPTMQDGERLIYRKHVQASYLAAGRVILFRLNPDNTWTKQRVLATARIFAVPGDELAQSNGRYVLNGR